MRMINAPKLAGEKKTVNAPRIKREKKVAEPPVQKFFISNTDKRISIRIEDKIFGIAIKDNGKLSAFMQNITARENKQIQVILNKIKEMLNNSTLAAVNEKLQAGKFATSLKVFYNHITKPQVKEEIE